MTRCWHDASGAIELYFYGELPDAEREDVERHLATCGDCRRTLEELDVIRAALDTRPDVAAPPGGDWSAFMAGLDSALARSSVEGADGVSVRGGPRRRALPAAFAIAALLALVTATVLMVLRQGDTSSPAEAPVTRTVPGETPIVAPADAAANADRMDPDVALTELSEQHFERSKLVVLGLATKDPVDSPGVNWDYERELAGSLLSDTRLYRHAAEERGMTKLADVMRDLELVLLQTSMSDSPDAESLARLQRLIRRRDLITKMDVVKTTGLLP
jgi:hypothetical protein